MEWQACGILINNPPEISNEEIMTALGISFEKPESNPLIEVINTENRICFGRYKRNIIISMPLKTISLVIDEGEQRNTKLQSIFPTSEIFCFLLQSENDTYGYVVFRDKKLIRFKAGNNIIKVMADEGEPLEEELELLSKSELKEEGKRIFYFDDSPERTFTDEQISEQFIFNIFKRYTGERLDKDETLLFHTLFDCYSIAQN